jgi:hypothetical protein
MQESKASLLLHMGVIKAPLCNRAFLGHKENCATFKVYSLKYLSLLCFDSQRDFIMIKFTLTEYINWHFVIFKYFFRFEI